MAFAPPHQRAFPSVAAETSHAWRPVDPQTAFFDGSYEKDDPPMVYAYPLAIMP